ncbi:GTPase HflX [Candidatus Shikimatogenerans silvanidophilus]|uniref:GTPase HflX n=1 Tax=Candidatus Shikimatogenerans silvanidophilus TaxID=2782547 RepID=UPI001BA47DD8|nr:GTPase HflX [Candidatus Shikimatogenerans silvanidophilus]
MKKKAIIIGVITKKQKKKKSIEYIKELEFLAITYNINICKKFIQKIYKKNSKTFLGIGKIKEIQKFIEINTDIKTILVDDELNTIQLKNLEILFPNKEIMDRTNLIINIFYKQAKTSYAKTQVELAKYQYILPRLQHMWTHLERQKGGIGMRGPGEKEIETDRRNIKKRISFLKKKLLKIDKQVVIQRKNRSNFIRLVLVGYTNVGKSSLMKLLSNYNVMIKNKLFSTLDTTVKKIIIKDISFLLSDTVGFIRKLPIQLIESFKSTLDEVREADILLHIVDISQENYKDQINYVNKILKEIGVKNKPIFLIFNKIDLINDIDLINKIKNKNKIKNNNIFISIKKNKNIDILKFFLYKKIKKMYNKKKYFLIPKF